MHALAAPRLTRTLVALTIDWVVIVLAVLVSRRLGHPLAYVAAVLLVAGRQHSLLILMHDAAHGSLSRNKTLNEILGQVGCAWPVLLDVRSFRYVHRKHHRLEGAAGDPDFAFRSDDDWRFPRSKASVARPVVQDFLGVGALSALSYLKYYGQAPRDPRWKVSGAKIAFHVLAVAAITWLGAWMTVLGYWVVPMLTALKAFVRWREIAEHYGVAATGPLDRTRTTVASPLEQFTIAPRNINFHLEHHLFPGVPWHSLPTLHAVLMRDPDYASRAHVTKGYVSALLECTTEPLAVPSPDVGPEGEQILASRRSPG